MLWGKQNRKAMIDPGATEGAIIGENLKWPDGTVVQVNQLLNPVVPVTPPGNPITSPTLWSLIIGIPAFIKSLSILAGTGLVVKRAASVAETVTLTAQDERIIITDGAGQVGDPTIAIADWPIIKSSIENGESWTIPVGFQMTVMNDFDIQGDLVVDGELFIHNDQPDIPDPIGPDFTYNGGGDLTQIDYDAGEQKVFTYNVGGDLERLDFIQDGVTYRKDFYYQGSDLDYIDEYYV